ncbi:glycosyltransferase involved in cell wall biosynthesis [Cryobacterium sp. CAN_C3]|uniref:glycosyltransferase family 4 protein n=1 Tax=unclassified Cryobacterium TaxID=2649013 RepID=UPI0018CA43CC|nr:glycosyltransferase family 1 protein [Cryobacterium sp. CAN_C3]MEC5155818.1 glycosyltransferase involved in cell wall biosynthesis [Cryobacterium sp. CAN_C3]
MSRVLVDLLFFTGTKGGMESYVRELYSRLEPRADGLTYVGLASRELAGTDTSWFPGTIIDSGISGENRIQWAFGELFRVARFARREHADLIHCPANLGPAWSRVPVVLTVHDLLPFRHPEYVPGAYVHVLRAMIHLAARTARRVLTPSAASSDDIVRFLRTPPERVDVVPLAGEVRSSSHALPVLRRTHQLLAVGNRMPHKNFETLLEALALMPEAARPHVVITGSHGDDPLTPVVARLGLYESVSLRGWLSTTELELLYAESTLFVFPTSFEGFGLPVLEAMALGCPVLCADIAVLREIAGQAAAYVAPGNAPELATAITGLLETPERLAELQAAGLAQAQLFTWERSARATAASFQRALREP